MSRSPYHSSNGEAGLPYFSNLNAAAMPFFMPFTPAISCGALSFSTSPHSALQPSSPAFVAPIATMVTPQSSDEHVTETSGASSIEQSLNNEGSVSINEDAAGEYNCDFTDFDIGGDDFLYSDPFCLDQVPVDNQGREYDALDPALNGDLPVQHPQTNHHAAASNNDMAVQLTQDTDHAALNAATAAQLPRSTHNTTPDNGMTAQYPQTFDGTIIDDGMVAQVPHLPHLTPLSGDMDMDTHHADALNKDMDAQNLETAYDTAINGCVFVQHPQTAYDAVIHGDMFEQHPHFFYNAAINNEMSLEHPQATHGAAPIGHMAVQHPHTSPPMDRPEHDQWTGDAYVVGQHHLQSSIEDDFDLTFADANGAYEVDRSAYPTPPLSYGVSSPEDDVRTDSGSEDETVDGEYNGDVDGEGETDDEYHPAMDAVTPSTNSKMKAGKAAVTTNKKNTRSGAKKVTEHTESEIEEVPESTFAVKQRKANVVIAKQNAQPTLARKLGQHVRVAYNANGVVEIRGIYWKAPANDHSIPRTLPEKFACVQAIIAAIRNNQACKEVETTVSFINRWANNATYFSPEEIECAAWRIVVSYLSTPRLRLHPLTQPQNTMIDIHTVGWTKQIFDPKLREQCQKTMFCTFDERFDELIDLFKHSKRTCIDVLKEERFYTAIGNPWELNTRSSSNQISNKTKGSNLKEVTKTKRKADEMEGGEVQGQEAIDARPKKKAKRSARK
jgi:hypothetical protein